MDSFELQRAINRAHEKRERNAYDHIVETRDSSKDTYDGDKITPDSDDDSEKMPRVDDAYGTTKNRHNI